MSRLAPLAVLLSLVGCSSAPPLEALRGVARLQLDHVLLDPAFEAWVTLEGFEVDGRCPELAESVRATYAGAEMTRDTSEAPGCGNARFTLSPVPAATTNPLIVLEDDTDRWEVQVVDPLTQRTCTVTPDPIIAGSPFTIAWNHPDDVLNADTPEADLCAASGGTCHPLTAVTRTGARTYEVPSFTEAVGAFTLHLNPDPQLANPTCDGPVECTTPGAFIGCGTEVTVVQP